VEHFRHDLDVDFLSQILIFLDYLKFNVVSFHHLLDSRGNFSLSFPHFFILFSYLPDYLIEFKSIVKATPMLLYAGGFDRLDGFAYLFNGSGEFFLVGCFLDFAYLS